MAEIPFHPMIGNIIAVLQLFGTIMIGNYINSILIKNYHIILSLAVGMAVISQFCYIILLMENYFWVLECIAWYLTLSGSLFIYLILRSKPFLKINKSFTFSRCLVLLISLSYILLAIGPPTQSDALNYHWGVPIYIINHNKSSQKLFIYIIASFD